MTLAETEFKFELPHDLKIQSFDLVVAGEQCDDYDEGDILTCPFCVLNFPLDQPTVLKKHALLEHPLQFQARKREIQAAGCTFSSLSADEACLFGEYLQNTTSAITDHVKEMPPNDSDPHARYDATAAAAFVYAKNKLEAIHSKLSLCSELQIDETRDLEEDTHTNLRLDASSSCINDEENDNRFRSNGRCLMLPDELNKQATCGKRKLDKRSNPQRSPSPNHRLAKQHREVGESVVTLSQKRQCQRSRRHLTDIAKNAQHSVVSQSLNADRDVVEDSQSLLRSSFQLPTTVRSYKTGLPTMKNSHLTRGASPLAYPGVLVLDSQSGKHWWQDPVTAILVRPATDCSEMSMLAGDYSAAPHFIYEPTTGLIHEMKCEFAVTSQHLDSLPNPASSVAAWNCPSSSFSTVAVGEAAVQRQPLSYNQQTALMTKLSGPVLDSSSESVTLIAPPAPHCSIAPPAHNAEQACLLMEPSPKCSTMLKQQRDISDTLRDPQIMNVRPTFIDFEGETDAAKRYHSTQQKANDGHVVYYVNGAPYYDALNKQQCLAEESDKSQSELSASTAPSREHHCDDASASKTAKPSSNSMHYNNAERIRGKFKADLARHVVEKLRPYLSSDCKLGRITNDDTFKYLAKKLTRTIMEKEEKRCGEVERLKCTQDVVRKAKEYIEQYMNKCGPVFTH